MFENLKITLTLKILKTTVEKQKQSEFENLMGDDMKGLVSSVQVFGNNEYSVWRDIFRYREMETSEKCKNLGAMTKTEPSLTIKCWVD